MGRHAGWLTAASALARKYQGDNPLFIYLPETDFDQDAFLKDLEKAFETNCNLIVCVSEGIHDSKGTFICEYDSSVGTDSFGHKMLAGCGKYLENLVRSRLGVRQMRTVLIRWIVFLRMSMRSAIRKRLFRQNGSPLTVTMSQRTLSAMPVR